MASCSSEIRVRVDVDPDTPAAAAESLHRHLDLNGISQVEDSSARVDYLLSVSVSGPDDPRNNALTTRVLAREWLAPVTAMWSPYRDARDAADDIELRILPVKSIKLPQRAVPDDGKYPGDPGYRWYNDAVVSLSARSRRAEADPIPEWFGTIPKEVDKPEIVWIGAVGDIMAGRGISRLFREADGLETVFGDTLAILRQFDVLMGNLEGAVTTRGDRAQKSYTFRYQPWVLDYLAEAGFDYLSLTNNHSFDFGKEGFLDTLRFLAEKGIATSGAGRDAEEAAQTARFEFRGQELQILSLGAYPREKNGFDGLESAAAGDERPGILWAGEFAYTEMVERFSGGTLNILMVHGGKEWSERPSEPQRHFYRTLIDMGADMVIGSHPHVLQGFESYGDGFIAYSLGNFLFPGMDETRYGEESLILSVGIIDETIRYVQPIPVQINGTTVALDTSGRILDRVLGQTKELNTAR